MAVGALPLHDFSPAQVLPVIIGVSHSPVRTGGLVVISYFTMKLQVSFCRSELRPFYRSTLLYRMFFSLFLVRIFSFLPNRQYLWPWSMLRSLVCLPLCMEHVLFQREVQAIFTSSSGNHCRLRSASYTSISKNRPASHCFSVFRSIHEQGYTVDGPDNPKSASNAR